MQEKSKAVRKDDKIRAIFTADLVLNKAFQEDILEKKGGKIKKIGDRIGSVSFHVRNQQGGILEPRILLDGTFFQKFLDSGRPEQYKVTLRIEAEETAFEHKGIPDKAEEDDAKMVASEAE